MDHHHHQSLINPKQDQFETTAGAAGSSYSWESQSGLPWMPLSNSDEEVILASNRPKRNAGRKKFRETRHPVYRGIRSRNNGKWVCEVREPNKKSRIWLGTYETAEMAARAHDVAALALRGRSACINFADSKKVLPIPDSNDSKDIQKAANEAAEMFRSTVENISEEKDVFESFDEETEFGMPGLLASMAEGLLISPPPSVKNDDDDEFNCKQRGNEDNEEISLWSFSI
ncbi:hypothetical protein AQUCO_01200144v1 [Aquilegia coerulea]|uniref:AP2/ERF domain-containing protein n=1 Tax=Aquilegia coerulea TaxID=218851 RepID=A0A2G5E4R2_AQUCA|nr:hypothetical protein AQUCO_01200144v1 [Aquilegia coerulea]PIA50716.1 hypothetical protein AQUCO_01200144v1 [Aquilegia coerulea]